ncbi:MAG: CobW family GTP-binding protein [Gulosibacter sp.]|uniref:CobW family GTP-binding protein n=1 Tax=Gulosibacter sp. TaxID=2817531 RepID=UPI003F91FD1E
MIHVRIIGGFLGAGKTTWLANHLKQAEAAPYVIVNEVAETSVDDTTLRSNWSHGARSSVPDIVSINGGCICCERIDEFRETLVTLVDESQRRNEPKSVFVETTGVAAIEPLVSLLTHDPVLKENARLVNVTVVVDGANGVRQLCHERLARAQVQFADELVVSKVDLVDADQVEHTSGVLRGLNPTAEILAAADGRERHLDEPLPRAIDFDDSTEVAAEPAVVWTAELAPTTDWAEYAVWLDALVRVHGGKILRSKGTIHTPVGLLLVQSVGAVIARPDLVRQESRSQSSSVDADSDVTTIVFVIQQVLASELERSFRAFVPSAILRTRQEGRHRGQRS